MHDWIYLLVSPVVLHDESRLFCIKIGLFSIPDCLFCLGKELLIVGAHTYINRTRQFDTDESAVAGRIGQDVVHIACGDEGGGAGELLYMTAIGWLVFHVWQLDEIFQESLLYLG